MVNFKKILCRLFDHKWKYNFPSLASKRNCERCGKKQKVLYNVNYKSDLSDLSVWIDEEKWDEANIKNQNEPRINAISQEEYKRIKQTYEKVKSMAKFEM